MIQKYNIALVPTTINESIIKMASVYSSFAHQYLLGLQSMPHVTLYQFKKDIEHIHEIWQAVVSTCFSSIYLSFQTLSFTTSDQKIYWLSLLPDQVELLEKMHYQIAGILQLPPKKYEPHMTLFNTLKNNPKKINLESFDLEKSIQDEFILILGKSDENGQLTDIVYTLS